MAKSLGGTNSPAGLTAAEIDDRKTTIAAIQLGLADVVAGRTKPARSVLRSLAKKYGLPFPALEARVRKCEDGAT